MCSFVANPDRLLVALFFQIIILASFVRSELPFLSSLPISKLHVDAKYSEKNIKSCPDCTDVEDLDITIAYTDQNGNIKLFNVSSKAAASSSIWENPLRLQEMAAKRGILVPGVLEKSSTVDNHLSFSEKMQTFPPNDAIKIKRLMLRRRRKRTRATELMHTSKENEMEMQSNAVEESGKAVNKAKDTYNIWRVEYANPNSDSTVKLMREQVIMAKVYASIARSKNERLLHDKLMKCIRESQDAIRDVNTDSELPSSALEHAKAMGHALSAAKYSLFDSEEISKKLRVMLQFTESSIDLVKKQNSFLIQHAAKTTTRPLHCLHLKLTTDYHFGLFAAKETEGERMRLEDGSLYHYAIFSDNVLATSVVVNSTVAHARDPRKHVFHVVTDKLNFAAMKMWFAIHPPRPATVHVENVDDFNWLNSSYCPVLRQLESSKLKEFYFKAHRPSSLSVRDENIKYRNPKYLSMLNHLRFYMPEVYPKLDKILFLDDDVVVQKDLTPLWDIDLNGMVNGAVETCKESFHRFDTYLNFSNPKISKNFDARACGWAFGMNMFDLREWKKRNITGIYHYWQDLNEDRKLWKLGSLPPGLITFYNLTYPLDRNWHVLGLGYDPALDLKQIDEAAVIHYNGNNKPWLDIAFDKYKPYWGKFLELGNPYIQRCFLKE